jgi:hypothetical protein
MDPDQTAFIENILILLYLSYILDFKPLAPHRCGFESRQELWVLSCEEAIQLVYGSSVVLLRCPFVPKIMHGRAPEVFPHQ